MYQVEVSEWNVKHRCGGGRDLTDLLFLLRPGNSLLPLLPLEPLLFSLLLARSNCRLQLGHLLLLRPPLLQLYTRTCKCTPESGGWGEGREGGGGREKKKNRKLLAITSCAKRIARCETTSWAPPLWRCLRCQGGLSNVSRCQTHPNLRNLKGNLTCMTHRHTQSNNMKIRKNNVVLAWLCSPS